MAFQIYKQLQEVNALPATQEAALRAAGFDPTDVLSIVACEQVFLRYRNSKNQPKQSQQTKVTKIRRKK